MSALFMISLAAALAMALYAQTQTPSYRKSEGRMIDYTPASAVYAGDVVVLGSMVCVAPLDIAANVAGEVAASGVFNCPNDGSTYTQGQPVYYNPTGNPQVGTAGTGAMTATAAGNYFAGTAAAASAAGNTVDVKLRGESSSGIPFPNGKYSTAALSGTTASAGQLTGARYVTMNNSGANPGTYTTRTAAQMFADIPDCQVGFTYIVQLNNGQATGTLTLAGGTGVTITGTATVAANVFRLYLVTIVSATAVTFQNIGSGVAP